MKEKLIEWLRRYLPAEILNFIVTLSIIALVFLLQGTDTVSPIAATLGTFIGFGCYYGLIFIKDVRGGREIAELKGQEYGKDDLRKEFRNFLLEFGPSSILRFILPNFLTIIFFSKLIEDPGFAQLGGVLGADVLFYIVTIYVYELLKRNGMRSSLKEEQ